MTKDRKELKNVLLDAKAISKLVTKVQNTIEQVIKGGYGESRWGVVVASPDLDGSYGSNGDAIFFFTTEGVYCEWNGKYFLCDRPLKLTSAPLLIYED